MCRDSRPGSVCALIFSAHEIFVGYLVISIVVMFIFFSVIMDFGV
jgi:hypothetical protein